MGMKHVVGATLVVAAAAGVLAAARHRHVVHGVPVAGGLLMGDAVGYDRMSRLFFGGLFRGIAGDIAAVAPEGARVLEVGCGPGHLSLLLAAAHALHVTAIDLDPAMIEQAKANASRSSATGAAAPKFLVADVSSLPFSDQSFDLVVSSFSMHHWSDPMKGMSEIGRVLRPGGRALVWDLARRRLPFHRQVHEHPAVPADMPLGMPRVTPWLWPARLALAQRMEFIRD